MLQGHIGFVLVEEHIAKTAVLEEGNYSAVALETVHIGVSHSQQMNFAAEVVHSSEEEE